ncbi:MAG: ComF family protein [Prevotella sp.]|nr:ComF family protein [Prevotella sp.]
MVRISFWSRVLDLISPRLCVVCGRRLSITEQTLCASCCLKLPRTDLHKNALDNELARLFWLRMPVERATALFYYQPHAESANIIYEMKYHDHPEIGIQMGRMIALETVGSGFFEGIDAIVPVPLAPKRERQRGYNQSYQIALGVSEVTGLPVWNKAVRRMNFKGSQTTKSRWERTENVDKSFQLIDSDSVHGRHLLLIDDVITTGATLAACGKVLGKAGDVKLSVLSLGFAKS